MADHINGPLHWERLGKTGRPIAFVHFTPADHSSFVYQMDHLSTWFQCIGIDLPGFGRSPTAQPGFSISDLAQACWEAVDEVTDEPAVLVGISTGSSVVRFMAHQQPHRTLAIVISGGGRSYQPQAVHQRIPVYQEHGLAFRYQHILEEYSPAFRESPQGQYFARLFAERNPTADLPTIIELFHALRQPRPEWLDAGLNVPTLVVTGSLDAGHERAIAHQARIPGSELVTIEGGGHACHMEKPWDWDDQFLKFLARYGLFDGIPNP
jgi:pimeloyl-ACP methyl ester carboxylesterase